MPCVLVIGASRGIGLEFARQYAEDGWRVIATARDDAGLARLKALGCEALRLDVADPASASRIAWSLDGESLDLALFVAGVMGPGGADAPPTQPEFDRVMHTNVLGAMQLLPQVVPLLQPGAAMACISSQMASLADCTGGSAWLYRVSKAALNMVVRAAQQAHPDRTLVALSPGWVRTDMGGDQAPLTAVQSVASMRRTLASLTPAQRGAFLDHDGQPLAW